MDTLLLSFPDYHAPAQRLAQQLAIPSVEVDLHHFPDGESRVRLPELNCEHLLVCRSLSAPNDKLVELLLVARTAREMGVKQLTLVAPYLCYMRQDKAFQPGEAVSQTIIGRYLAELFDNLVTVDPHLHRTHDLKEAVPCKQALALSATGPLGAFLAAHDKNYFLIGPDEESRQWVSAIADVADLRYAVAHKTRYSDKYVEVTLPEVDVAQADVVLVDDMISTGHTMVQTARRVLQLGAKSVNCLVTHALYNNHVTALLETAGIGAIWSSDSIIHPGNIVRLDQLLAGGIQQLT